MLYPKLVDRVRARLELGHDIPVDLAGLTQVYRAWSRHVPFDNLQKRAALALGGELPGGSAESFFESYLDEGSGGTCWATSRSLHALLISLGFPARRAAGTMVGGPEIPPKELHLTHGTVLVRFDQTDHLVDTHMLTSKPLPLLVGSTTAVDGVFGARATPGETETERSEIYRLGKSCEADFCETKLETETERSEIYRADAIFRIWFEPFSGRPEMSCLLQRLEVDDEFYRMRHQRSATGGPFNTQVYVRRQTSAGYALVLLGKRIDITPEGVVTTTAFGSRRERDDCLASLGYASKLIARVPDDEVPVSP